jgi:hypothetical protein
VICTLLPWLYLDYISFWTGDGPSPSLKRMPMVWNKWWEKTLAAFNKQSIFCICNSSISISYDWGGDSWKPHQSHKALIDTDSDIKHSCQGAVFIALYDTVYSSTARHKRFSICWHQIHIKRSLYVLHYFNLQIKPLTSKSTIKFIEWKDRQILLLLFGTGPKHVAWAQGCQTRGLGLRCQDTVWVLVLKNMVPQFFVSSFYIYHSFFLV